MKTFSGNGLQQIFQQMFICMTEKTIKNLCKNLCIIRLVIG